MTVPYDAILVVSFGGPEGRDDVLPFLENVLRGKPVPRERLLEVAEHYYHFDGVSPINAQVRELIAALRLELDRSRIDLPVYWGNRNWTPYLPDTLREMAAAGVQRALAVMTSAYSSYSGCRQYRENVEAARTQVGPEAPLVDKLRVFYNHPDFIGANVERLQAAQEQIPVERREQARLIFTAHSIPLSMANHCNYEAQLRETCRLVAAELDWPTERFQLAWQSRSGRPQDPWLEPDILDVLRRLGGEGVQDVVLSPIGFLSDHMEVLFDLDYEASHLAGELGMTLVRAGTVGTHPRVVSMLRELIEERLGRQSERRAIGHCGPSHDVCPVDCCLYPMQRPPAGRPG